MAGVLSGFAATGSVTDVGAAENTFAIDWGDTDPARYTVAADLGMLEVTPRNVTVSIAWNGAGEAGEIEYDGKPHGKELYKATADVEGSTAEENSDGYWVIRMPWDEEITAEILGGGTNTGEYTMTCAAAVTNGTAENYSIAYGEAQKLTINQNSAVITITLIMAADPYFSSIIGPRRRI